MTEPEDLTVLLHATDPALLPKLHVLADRLADLADIPSVVITGPDDLAAGDAAAMAARLDRQQIGLIAIAGDQIPGALVDQARARGVTLMLVEASSPVPAGRRRLIPGATRSLLSGFDEIHACNAAARAALRRVLRSEQRIVATGAMARYLPASGCNTHELEALRSELGARPVWFAQDLPAQEYEAVLFAHAHALRRAHRLLLIAQPRDPQHGAALAARARDVGFSCAQRGLDDGITETTQVYVADADDDPGLFLRLSPLTYLGGTLTRGLAVPSALDPASLGSALLIGPFAPAMQTGFLDTLVQGGGARRVTVPPALGEALTALLSPETGADAALKAWDLATAGSAATDTIARAIAGWVRGQEGAKARQEAQR